MTGYNPFSFEPEGLKRFLRGMDRRIRDLERSGDWRFDTDSEVDEDSEIAQPGRLLVLAASANSIASGGDRVEFGSTITQLGFDGGIGPSGGFWVHPVSAVYVLTYEHAWASYTDAATVEIEVDGTVPSGGTLGSGSGQYGQGTIEYWAAAGSAGRIKVTQSSGSAQTCNATVRVAITGATDSTSTFSGVRLLVNDELVTFVAGAIPTGLTDATVIIGALSTATSQSYYDDVRLTQGSDVANMVSNGEFESATVVWDASSEVVGNFATYAEGGGTTARSTTQARSGSYSVAVDAVADVAYVLQDLTMTDGVDFELDLYVYPATLGGQAATVQFGWNRTTGSTTYAAAEFGSAATTINAFGLSASGPALPTGQWSRVTLQVVT